MEIKSRFWYMLAPLEDMTDTSFRTLCHKYGADLTFTELVRFESLAKNNKPSWQRITLTDETPTVILLIGAKEYFLKKFLKMFEPQKGFQGFDLNLGCPAPNFVNNGTGAAMIKRINHTRTLVNIMRDNGYFTSIKMRLGLNQYEKKKKAYLNLINAVNADYFIVHARHGKNTYHDKADWSVFPECVKTGKAIIANGDIKTKEDVEKLKEMGLAGAMIGRAAIKNPGIFSEFKGLPIPDMAKLREEYLKIVKERNSPLRYRENIKKYMGSGEEFEEERGKY